MYYVSLLDDLLNLKINQILNLKYLTLFYLFKFIMNYNDN